MGFREDLITRPLIFDGAMGTALQKKALKIGALPERLCITDSKTIVDIHLSYLNAGSDIISTNTFGANALKLGDDVTHVISAAVACAKEARAIYLNQNPIQTNKYIALDVGPLGVLLSPMGTLSFDAAYDYYKEQAIAGENAGCDLILLETFTDLYEAKCAILACKEHTKLPVLCTMSFEATGRTFTGTDVETMVAVLEGLGTDAIGFNCSFGALEMLPLVRDAVKLTRCPIMVQPNAGLPKVINQITVYEKNLDVFKEMMNSYLELGVSILGGCCGTETEHIKIIKCAVEAHPYAGERRRAYVPVPRVASYSQTVNFGDRTIVIGERINPTGKKRLKEAILNRESDYILREAILQVEQGADILDINMGVPGIDEPSVMREIVTRIQSVLNVPLQIDASKVSSIEQGVRYYNGKPIINSVNGKRESLNQVLPIAKKYGACVIGLTLDESGIPSDAQGRFEIAQRIVNEAVKIGIPKENLFIDCLALTASAQQADVIETIKTIERVKRELQVATVLGVSNVSFGLPAREGINQSFLTLTLYAGLDAPIINPGHPHMMQAIAATEVLLNIDVNAKRYIETYGNMPKVENAVVTEEDPVTAFMYAIRNGLIDQAKQGIERLLLEKEPMEIVDKIIIPSLNQVGTEYENGKLFLPQLMQSAETVQAAFEILKTRLLEVGGAPINRGKVILATVYHDVHDIGKNIVKVVMENYGFQIFDLGKNVPPQVVVENCLKYDVKLIGLSALMTTTVVSMKETIHLLREKCANVTIVVGGAVLSEDIAHEIGADYFAKDASEMVKIATRFFES